MFSNPFFFLENRAVYEIMSKNMLQLEGQQMTSQYGAYALHSGYVYAARVHDHTHKHISFVIFIAFPRQQWYYYVKRALSVLFQFIPTYHLLLVLHIYRLFDLSLFLCGSPYQGSRLSRCRSPNMKTFSNRNCVLTGRNGSVSIATRYGIDGPEFEIRWEWDCRTHPDRPRGHPSHLYNGWRVCFPGV
jgi:hypothetical protein